MVASTKRLRLTPRTDKNTVRMGEIQGSRKRHRSDYVKVRLAIKQITISYACTSRLRMTLRS